MLAFDLCPAVAIMCLASNYCSLSFVTTVARIQWLVYICDSLAFLLNSFIEGFVADRASIIPGIPQWNLFDFRALPQYIRIWIQLADVQLECFHRAYVRICEKSRNFKLFCSQLMTLVWYQSLWNDIFNFLPSANEVCKGYVFTPVCESFCSWGGQPQCILRYTPGRYTPPRQTPPGSNLLGRKTSLGITPPTPYRQADGYCCRRYASYRNAFLLSM